jgi:membrane-associated phospholipid phosphatase
VYLGAHFPLDVAVGAVLGSACGVAARLIGL